MKHRWVIRGIFIALLALSVGGWMTSAWYLCSAGVWYGNRGICAYTHCGCVNLCFIQFGSDTIGGNGYDVSVKRQPGARFWPEAGTLERYHWVIGFNYEFTGGGKIVLIDGRTNGTSTAYRTLTLSYWVLILLSTAALWFVWRKTRPKLDPSTAFPVEVRPTPSGAACKHAG